MASKKIKKDIHVSTYVLSDFIVTDYPMFNSIVFIITTLA
jgi:hypothetical protein